MANNIQDRARSVLAGLKRVMEEARSRQWASASAEAISTTIFTISPVDGLPERVVGEIQFKADRDCGCLAVNLLPALVVAMEGDLASLENLKHAAELIPQGWSLIHDECERIEERLAAICDLIEPELVRVEGRK
jgi:hypothetical protein